MVIDYTVLFVTLIVMFLMVLLLVGSIYSRLHWIVKATMITMSLIVSAVLYETVQGSLGWPVGDTLPKKFQFVSAVIDEPTKLSKGAIYVWYKDYIHSEPRSIKMPYSRPMHQQMQQAQEKAKGGRGVHMEMKGTKAEKKQQGSVGTQDEDLMIPDFVPPPSTMPDKEAQPD